jgi:hypothetical protein
VHRDPDGLVDDDDLVVLVQDLQALDGLGGHDLGLVVGVRQVDLEPAAGHEPVGLARRAPVEADRAVLGQGGDHGAREPEHAGEAGVETHPVEPVGDG